MSTLPAAVGVKDATRLIKDGELIEVDGATGEVRRVVPVHGRAWTTLHPS